MKAEKLFDEFSKLPPEAQKQVENFISLLQMRYSKQPDTQERIKRAALENEPFIGIWRNREDMRDSRSWLRGIRKSEWGEAGE